MKPEDLYRLAWADDPRVSPDGRTVAFVAFGLDEEKNDYTASIWLVPIDGSEAPRRMTAGPKQDLAPRWSPDGTKLAFVSNRDEELKAKQLYVIPVAGGEPVRRHGQSLGPRRSLEWKRSRVGHAWWAARSDTGLSARTLALREMTDHPRSD